MQAQVVVQADDVRSVDTAAAIDRFVASTKGGEGLLPGVDVDYSKDDRTAVDRRPAGGSWPGRRVQPRAVDDPRRASPERVRQRRRGDGERHGRSTAASVDFKHRMAQRLPLVFGFVLTLAFVLMLVTFRSIVIPIKAIVLNLLSVGAAYGVLTLMFQHGVGADLLGFDTPGSVTAWLPLFLFVVLFGLSMDYHVFILSRVREAVDRGESTTDGVRHAIRTTAGTVTSAAVVMVAVFAIFATLSMIDMKEMGIGLAIAVLIDATIIRAVLLPASMTLLGRWNWYLPGKLGWLPRLGREPEPDAAR